MLPSKLNSHWEVIDHAKDGLEENFITTVRREEETEIFGILKESFLKAYEVTDKELKFCPTIDCLNSGSTAVTLVKQVCSFFSGHKGSKTLNNPKISHFIIWGFQNPREDQQQHCILLP